MPKGKTIRQIADEIGVTRQAVYQKIKSNKSAVNKGVNVSTDSVYTSVNDFTPCKQEKSPINTAFSDDTVNKGVNEGVNVSTNMEIKFL